MSWQMIVVTLFSCGALIIALYCLIFMVPLQRFKQHINSLGGGMKGVEAHVEGVRDRVEARLADLETTAAARVRESREAMEAAVERLGRENRDIQHELERLRKDVQALQAELRQAGGEAQRAAQGCETLGKRLGQLLSDFDALDVELRESVRQISAEALSQVESTVLAALDAWQDELIYGTGERPGPSRGGSSSPRPASPHRTPPPPATRRDRIIQMEPLFGPLHADEKPEQADDKADADAPEGGTAEDDADSPAED